MNLILTLLAIMAIFLIVAAIIAAITSGRRKGERKGIFLSKFRTANNEGVAGTHKQATSKLADAAWANRHLLVMIGSDSAHVNLCNQAQRPYGFTKDAPAAIGDPIQVEFLSCHEGTILANATGALGQGVGIYTCATPGYVSGLPVAAGTYWKIGESKEASQETQDGEFLIEVEPGTPLKVVVDNNGNATLVI